MGRMLSAQPSLFDPVRSLPVRHPVGVRRGPGAIDRAFVAPVLATPTRALAGMVRGNDAIEAQRAAVDVLPTAAQLRRRILEIIATEGPQTDRELETRTEFRGYGPSTVRKRRSELAHQEPAALVAVGRRDKMTVWGIPATVEKSVETVWETPAVHGAAPFHEVLPGESTSTEGA